MNFKQTVLVCIGLLIECGMLLYPPWRIETGGVPAEVRGHVFVWRVGNDIDVVPLVIECMVVAILTIIVVILFGTKKNR